MILENNRLISKGASEIIVECCSHYNSKSKGIIPIDNLIRSEINKAIEDMAE